MKIKVTMVAILDTEDINIKQTRKKTSDFKLKSQPLITSKIILLNYGHWLR